MLYIKKNSATFYRTSGLQVLPVMSWESICLASTKVPQVYNVNGDLRLESKTSHKWTHLASAYKNYPLQEVKNVEFQ